MCEDAPCCGCCGPQSDNQEAYYEQEEARGWAGDGSGEDDFADYNANEADDYAHEGAEDAGEYNDECEQFLD